MQYILREDYTSQFNIISEVYLRDVEPGGETWGVRRIYDETYLAGRESLFLYGDMRDMICQCAHAIHDPTERPGYRDNPNVRSVPGCDCRACREINLTGYLHTAYTPTVSTIADYTGPVGATGYTGGPGPEAVQRSRELLLSCLDDKQRNTLTDNRWFETRGSNGGKYRIMRHFAYNVLKKKGINGAMKLCTTHGYMVPIYDTMLAQKLMIETDESGFLETANRGNETSWR